MLFQTTIRTSDIIFRNNYIYRVILNTMSINQLHQTWARYLINTMINILVETCHIFTIRLSFVHPQSVITCKI